MTNSLKHAGAHRLAIALDQPSDGWLRLIVSDDGKGFDIDAESGGVGLGTMRDYAEAVGGRVVIKSTNGRGTAVTATLPLGNGASGANPQGA